MMEALIGFGYVGLLIACILSASILPLSSDFVLVAVVAAGLDWTLCLAVATLGSWAGGMTNYYLGRLGKLDWLEKKAGLNRQKLDRIQTWLQGKSALIAFFGWLPAIGNLMVVALGMMQARAIKIHISLFLGMLCRTAVVIFLTLRSVDILLR